MSSPPSPRIPIMRWVMLALLAGVIWVALSGIVPMQALSMMEENSALASGNIKKATALFDADIRNNPTNPDVYEAISGLCSQYKHDDLAIRYLESALLICKDLPRPERARIYLALSANYSNIEPKPQRRAIYAAQRAAELDPTSARCLNAYGYILADNNVDIDVAVAELTRALELLKKQGDTLDNRSLVCMTEDSYGWALYKQGKYDLAAAALYQAINDIPEEIANSPAAPTELKVLYYHLGAAYHKQQKPDEARAALQTALSFDKSYKEAQDELKAVNTESPPAAARAEKPPTATDKPPATTGKPILPSTAPSSSPPKTLPSPQTASPGQHP